MVLQHKDLHMIESVLIFMIQKTGFTVNTGSIYSESKVNTGSIYCEYNQSDFSMLGFECNPANFLLFEIL